MPNYSKFSGVRTRCPKCATFTNHSVRHFADTTSEYMVRNCGTCTYTWRELVADTPASDTGDGGSRTRPAAPDFWSLLGLVDVDKVVDKFIDSLREKGK